MRKKLTSLAAVFLSLSLAIPSHSAGDLTPNYAAHSTPESPLFNTTALALTGIAENVLLTQTAAYGLRSAAGDLEKQSRVDDFMAQLHRSFDNFGDYVHFRRRTANVIEFSDPDTGETLGQNPLEGPYHPDLKVHRVSSRMAATSASASLPLRAGAIRMPSMVNNEFAAEFEKSADWSFGDPLDKFDERDPYSIAEMDALREHEFFNPGSDFDFEEQTDPEVYGRLKAEQAVYYGHLFDYLPTELVGRVIAGFSVNKIERHAHLYMGIVARVFSVFESKKPGTTPAQAGGVFYYAELLSADGTTFTVSLTQDQFWVYGTREADSRVALHLEDPELTRYWEAQQERYLEWSLFVHRLSEETGHHGLLWNFPEADIQEFMRALPDPRDEKSLEAMSGFVTLNVLDEGFQHHGYAQVNLALLIAARRAGPGFSVAALKKIAAQDSYLAGRLVEFFRKNSTAGGRLDLWLSCEGLLQESLGLAGAVLFIHQLNWVFFDFYHRPRIKAESLSPLDTYPQAPRMNIAAPYRSTLAPIFEGHFTPFLASLPTVANDGGDSDEGKIGGAPFLGRAGPALPAESAGKVRLLRLPSGEMFYVKRVNPLRVRYPEEEIDLANRANEAFARAELPAQAQHFVGVLYDEGQFYLISKAIAAERTAADVPINPIIEAILHVLQEESEFARLKDILIADTPTGPRYYAIDFESLAFDWPAILRTSGARIDHVYPTRSDELGKKTFGAEWEAVLRWLGIEPNEIRDIQQVPVKFNLKVNVLRNDIVLDRNGQTQTMSFFQKIEFASGGKYFLSELNIVSLLAEAPWFITPPVFVWNAHAKIPTLLQLEVPGLFFYDALESVPVEKLISALAAVMARMHAAGYIHNDLSSKLEEHLKFETTGDSVRAWLFDFGRAFHESTDTSSSWLQDEKERILTEALLLLSRYDLSFDEQSIRRLYLSAYEGEYTRHHELELAA